MRNTMFYLIATFLIAAPVPASDLPETVGALPVTQGLPDLFTFNDGTRVQSLDDWNRRRSELIAPLMYYQYGRMPPRPDQVTARVDKQQQHESRLGTETWLTLVIDSRKKLEMRIVIYQPNTDGPHPVIIEEEGSLGGSKNAWMFLQKNYMFIEYARHDLDPDKNNTIGPCKLLIPNMTGRRWLSGLGAVSAWSTIWRLATT